MNIPNIIQGFFKLAKGEELTPRQIVRARICMRCDHRTKMNTCGVCYCYLPAKIRVNKERCPKKRW